MNATDTPDRTATAKARTTPAPSTPLAVRSRQGRLGFLDALLLDPRLLLVRAPQVRGGLLLIPFEAVERIDREGREILLRAARDALDLAAGSADRDDGCRD